MTILFIFLYFDSQSVQLILELTFIGFAIKFSLSNSTIFIYDSDQLNHVEYYYLVYFSIF